MTNIPPAAPAAPAAAGTSTVTEQQIDNSSGKQVSTGTDTYTTPAAAGATGAAGGILGNSLHHPPIFETDTRQIEQTLGIYLCFDSEFDPTDNDRIDAVSFVDSLGNREVKFRIRDFGGNEGALLDYTNTKLLAYRWILGWNIQGNTGEESNPKITDLALLHKRCLATGIPSIIRPGYKGVPFINHSEIGVIDLLNVYGKIMVKDGIYHSYRTNRLGDVSIALLGYGKYKNYSGEEFHKLSIESIEEAEKYSLQDSQLVLDLARYKKFEALGAMFAVSSIIGMSFERVCRTNLTTWWSAVFDKTVPKHMKPTKGIFTGTYKGADVIKPKKGLYDDDVVVVDGKSLYPSVAINNNISFDTISTCERCKNDPTCRISNMFPYEFTKDFKFVVPNRDWICKCPDKKGFFVKHLIEFKAERLRQKALGNKAKQHALKILINGGYGAFGSEDFDYCDPRSSGTNYIGWQVHPFKNARCCREGIWF